MTDPSYIPTYIGIPLIIVLLAILIFMKIQDYRKLKAEAANKAMLEYAKKDLEMTTSIYRSNNDTPIFDQMADRYLGDETYERIAGEPR